MSEGPTEKWQKGIVQQEKKPAQLGQKSTWSATLKGIVSRDFHLFKPIWAPDKLAKVF